MRKSIILISISIVSIFVATLGFDIGMKNTPLNESMDIFILFLLTIPAIFGMRAAGDVSRESRKILEEKKCRTWVQVEEDMNDRKLYVQDFKGTCKVKHQDGSTFKFNHALVEKDYTE
ncbi:MAG: hypothetical protein SLAVMIC_00751 [uncultured marine phage]|uniref:Uncharacterized protein n=1 Tax=uncultured marine phage TaxID=707152 RepID=A0A8D9CCM5_9VIRU|nr:MAG: hypothetical protein SLAVMIC_00751 [uncultured marine phage]